MSIATIRSPRSATVRLWVHRSGGKKKIVRWTTRGLLAAEQEKAAAYLAADFPAWLDRYLSGMKDLLARRSRGAAKTQKAAREPDDALEELVRELRGLPRVLLGMVLPEGGAVSEEEPRIQAILDKPSRAIPVSFNKIGEPAPDIPLTSEEDIIDDEVRIERMPPRPTRTVLMQFVHVGRQQPRISEDPDG